MRNNEVWKDIKGYEGLYQISNLGRVKSVARKIKYKQYVKETTEIIMKLDLNKRGYLYVHLCKNGKYKAHRVHRLVAEAFVENPEHKEQVNHIDRNVLNNQSCNLEWCTNAENMEHAKKTGFRRGKSLENIHSIRTA